MTSHATALIVSFGISCAAWKPHALTCLFNNYYRSDEPIEQRSGSAKFSLIGLFKGARVRDRHEMCEVEGNIAFF